MEIAINNQPKTVTEQLTVQQLLDAELPGRQKGVAVAINNTVVQRADWASRSIKPGDNILIIKATQGG